MVDAGLDDFKQPCAQMNKSIDKSLESIGLNDCAFNRKFRATVYKHYNDMPNESERSPEAIRGWSLGRIYTILAGQLMLMQS